MSHERILKTLVNLGLKPSDAKVYLHLATKGAQSVREIAEALNLHKQHVSSSLKRLRIKEIVNATPANPATYFAVSLSQLIEIFVNAKMKEANGIEQNRDEILAFWQSLIS